jgi:hypothetical protein
MYARNISAFLMHLFATGRKEPDLEDEIARDTLVTQAGEIVNARVREFYSLPSKVAAK